MNLFIGLIALMGVAAFGQESQINYLANSPLGSEAIAKKGAHVVGYRTEQVKSYKQSPIPFHWDLNQNQVTKIENLKGYTYFDIRGVNDRGWVVGISRRGTPPQQAATVWTAASGPVKLPPARGDVAAGAYAVNHDTISGYSVRGKQIRPVLWHETPSGGWRAEVLPYYTDLGRAFAISDNGRFVAGQDGPHAILWERKHNGWTRYPITASAMGHGVNDSGTVVGNILFKKRVGKSLILLPEAYVWHRTTGVRMLGYRGKDYKSRATAINNAGIVVGNSGTMHDLRAFVWDEHHEGLQTVDGLEGYGVEFKDIDDDDSIAGNTTRKKADGSSEIPSAFVW